MKRRFSPRNLIAAAVPALAAALFSGGCADNHSMLFVRGVLAWPSGQCTVQADPSQPMRLYGVLDTLFRNDYVAPLLIGNQLTQRGSRDRLRNESSRIALRGAVVTVKTPQGQTIKSYTTDGSGFVDPGTGEDPGYGIMSAQLIPPGLALPSLVTVSVHVFGTTLGDDEIESNDLLFPITVCRGCTVSYPTEALNIATQECTGTDKPTTPLPCFIGEDDPIDCRYCSANVPKCKNPAAP